MISFVAIPLIVLAYKRAKHNTSDSRYGPQFYLRSAKLLLLLTESSMSPLRSSGWGPYSLQFFSKERLIRDLVQVNLLYWGTSILITISKSQRNDIEISPLVVFIIFISVISFTEVFSTTNYPNHQHYAQPIKVFTSWLYHHHLYQNTSFHLARISLKYIQASSWQDFN